MNEIVELDGVVKVFKRGVEEIRAIDGMSLSIERGDYISIAGPSGSGKTTLLNLIGCIDKPSSGRVLIGGIETVAFDDKELARVRASTFGFVFQQFFLVPTLTALENVMLPGGFAVKRNRHLDARALELLELMGLADRATHFPSELSGGEMQRVAMARALINEPAILLADEPTGNLDSRKSDEVAAIFDRLNSDGLTVILVTHNEAIAERAARSIHLIDGDISSDVRSRTVIVPEQDAVPDRVLRTATAVIEQPATSAARGPAVAERPGDTLSPVAEAEAIIKESSPEDPGTDQAPGYMPTVIDRRHDLTFSGLFTIFAAIMVFFSAFGSWVADTSGFGLVTVDVYTGTLFGGNFLVRTYSGRGAIFFTGLWPLFLSALMLAAGLALILKRRVGSTLALIAGGLGTLIALIDILMVYLRLQAGFTGQSASVNPGTGLWVFAGFSMATFAIGLYTFFRFREPSME